MRPQKLSEAHKIEIRFYKGAYGPTVQIHLPSDELLAAMKDILCTLASGGATEIKLHDLPFAELSGGVAHTCAVRMCAAFRARRMSLPDSNGN